MTRMNSAISVRRDALAVMPAPARMPSPAGRHAAGIAQQIARIEAALETLALLLEQDAAYLPVFRRLEAEHASLLEGQRALERAKRYLPGARG